MTIRMPERRPLRGKVIPIRPRRRPRSRSYPLGARLREMREAAGLAQQWVADQLRKPQSWVSRVEGGHYMVPADALPLYAAVLGVTVAEIFSETIARAS